MILIVNLSPLGYCSSLLITAIEMHRPQVLDFNSLHIAVDTFLINHDPVFKIGMNSLGAFASVNHLHFHVYKHDDPLYLEHLKSQKYLQLTSKLSQLSLFLESERLIRIYY